MEIGNTRGVRILEGHQATVYGVSWHPTKRILASSSGDSSAKLWQIGDAEKATTEMQGAYKQAFQVSGEKRSSLLRNLPHINAGAKSTQIDVTSLHWNSKKNMLVTGASDGIARVWDENGNVQSQLKAGEGIVFAAKWNPSGTRILTVGCDKGKLSVLPS